MVFRVLVSLVVVMIGSIEVLRWCPIVRFLGCKVIIAILTVLVHL